MNENCTHSVLANYIEKLRKQRRITIQDLAAEARISTKTYLKIKKGTMPI